MIRCLVLTFAHAGIATVVMDTDLRVVCGFIVDNVCT